jgi:hypothetical protein
MKMDLKKWNEEVFGNIGKQKKDLLVGIHDLNIIAEERPYLMLKCGEKISRDLEVYSAQRNMLEEKVKGSVVERGR